jgi:hypothetical protein
VSLIIMSPKTQAGGSLGLIRSGFLFYLRLENRSLLEEAVGKYTADAKAKNETDP